MLIFDTIVSLCTPGLKSSICVIRLVGKDAFNILSHLIKKDVNTLQPRYMYYSSFYENKEDESTLIDKSMFVIFKGKESFCGEDTVEFYLHGSMLIATQLIQACIKYGARQAQGGEFTAKAYYNGKMDLTEAEAVNQLINARTERSKNFALKTLQGNASKKLKSIKDELNLLEAEIEVNIDYPEFDEDDTLINKVKKGLPKIIKESKNLASNSKQSLYLFNGVKVALVGEPNVGKSTLLNKILGFDKAIVTNIPGTTRDIVEGEKEVNGIIYKFFDTAGIREIEDQIEQIGIEKSYQICKEADVILVLSDKKQVKEELEKLDLKDIVNTKPTIFVSTKSDINGENDQADISIGKDDSNLDKLFELINFKLDIDNKAEDGFTSERELNILNKFVATLESILEDIELGFTIDIIEIKLVEATTILDSLLNVNSSLEDIYSTIFKHFCIGK